MYRYSVVSRRLISVLGDDAELMYRPNAATHSLLARDGTFHRVILQSKQQLMTAGM